MLIQNYGLFWREDGVFWGYQKNRGMLLGRYAKKKRAASVDFRNQQGVYVLYDDNYRIIYVGQTGTGDQRLFVRLRQHRSDHLAQRWSRFSWFGICPVVGGSIDTKVQPQQPSVAGVLDHIEAILLASAEPPLNLQRGRFGDAVQQYLQDRFEGEVDDRESQDDEEE